MTSVRHGPAGSGGRPLDPVLAAARSLVLDVGFRRTTVADVARRAGVSRMTVYRQYADLAAIWSALLTAELTTVLTDAEAAAADQPHARARITTIGARLVERVSRHPLLRRALDVDPEVLLPLVVDRLGSTQRAVRTWLEDEVRAGQADGSVRADLDPAAAALALLLTGQSFVFAARVIEADAAGRGLTGELAALVEHYLQPTVPS